METLIVQLEAVEEPEWSVHDGEAFVYVLEGLVDLEIGEEHFELEPGDSAYYHSTTPRVIVARESKAVILAVSYEG